jgi:hypothetical protein
MDAVEIKGQRLVKLRNPWGRKEWDGKWSDGSKEWTAEWMQLLKHEFGNDGVFWISYEDLLKKYQHFDRTRIFGSEWHITQQWTSVHVPWSADYHSTKFSLTLQKESPVVIVLSQLDETYFAGLEGSYSFELQFRVEKDGDDDNDYLVRSHGNYAMNRSVSTDITLEAGTYSILMKIIARPNSNFEIEEALPGYAENRREKLIQMGLSYDLAHAKGIIVESERERRERKEREKKRKARDREKLKKEMRERAMKDWTKRKALHKRDKKWQAKKARADARRMAQGRPIDEDEIADSMDAANGSERDAGREPLVLKSFSGEIIEMPSRKPPGVPEAVAAPDAEQDSVASAVTGITAERAAGAHDESTNNESAQDAEQDSIAAAVSRDAYPTPPLGSSASAADSVFQPLSEVLATADAESAEKPNEHGLELERPPTPIIQINGVDAVTDVRPLPNLPPLAPAEADLGRDTSVSAQPQTNGNLDTHAEPAPDREEEAEHSSETDSFPDFDYQTDLDMESDLDSDDRAARRRARPPRNPSPKTLPDDDDTYSEPWNAVCVVGLRVYSLVSGADITLEVVRPRIEDSDEDEDDEKRETVLDRDDPAKGAEVENSGRDSKEKSDVID